MMTWAQRLTWWAYCEDHSRPVEAVVGAYVTWRYGDADDDDRR
jgi:hypothetical protein